MEASAHRLTGRRLLCWATVIVAVSAGFAACGDDDEGDDAAVEAVLNGIIADFNEGDGPGFAAAFTDTGLGVFFENPAATRAELEAIAAEAVGSDQIDVRDITDVSVSGDTATAEMELGVGDLVLHEKYTLVRDDGDWVIDGYESLGEE